MDYVLDHAQCKGAAAATYTKQDVAYGNHEKSDLEDRIDTWENSFEMMSWRRIVTISLR
jgi:hypothetical protein